VRENGDAGPSRGSFPPPTPPPPLEEGFGKMDWIAAITVVVLWGLNVVAVKAAVATLPPFLLTGIRFVLVALVLVPFVRPRRDQLPAIAGLAAVLGVGHFGLLFFAIRGMDAASAAIAIQLCTPFSALLAWLVYGEPLGWARAAGMAVAFAGVAVLAGEPHLAGLTPLLLITASAFAWAVSNVLIKRIGPISPLALNGGVALFAAPMLLAVSLAFEDGHAAGMAATGGAGWSGLAYTTVGSTLIAYTLWYRLIGRYSMNRVVPFTLLAPCVGLAAGILVLGEPLTWQKLVGGALTVLGVAVIQLLSPSPPIVTAAEPEPGA
jgi:O-acetylserine/cysteine efflux transporter